MVEGLSKRIAGDWMELSQAGLSLNTLVQYFNACAGHDTPASIAVQLAGSVLHGVIEYKESILHPLFQTLEEMKYKSIAFEELARQKDAVGRLVFVTLIQRLYAAGSLAPAEDEATAKDGSEAAGADLKLILSDVMARVQQNPALKNNTAVKLILTQLAVYQREREVMEKLTPNIKDKKQAAAFRRNFSNTFQNISQNIRKHYRDFLAAERADGRRGNRPSLARYPLRGLLSLMTKQAREFARIRSTLAFALEQKYKVREICVHLFNEKKAVFSLLEEESAACRKLSEAVQEEEALNDGNDVSLAFASEIAGVLEKQAPLEKR